MLNWYHDFTTLNFVNFHLKENARYLERETADKHVLLNFVSSPCDPSFDHCLDFNEFPHINFGLQLNESGHESFSIQVSVQFDRFDCDLLIFGIFDKSKYFATGWSLRHYLSGLPLNLGSQVLFI